MYATDVRQTDVRQKHRLTPPPCGGGGIISDELLELVWTVSQTTVCDNRIAFVNVAVDEAVIMMLDSGNHELVFAACGVLMNLMVDDDKRPKLLCCGGVSKYVISDNAYFRFDVCSFTAVFLLLPSPRRLDVSLFVCLCFSICFFV